MMKSYYPLLAVPLLLLASCGSEPARRAAQSQAAPVAVQVAARFHRGLERQLRGHRHGACAHHRHHFE